MTREKSGKTRIIIAVACFICAVAITYILNAGYGMSATPFDLAIQKFFISIRTDFFNVLISTLTHCSDTITIILLCIILVILPNRKQYGFPVTLAELVGLAIYKPMKHLFLRARPDVVYHLVQQGGYSFPSGHSTTSVIVYGLLFYLIRKNCKDEKLKNILSSICLILAVTIAPSRLYVGVHWATDVICGALIGFGVLMLAITVIERTNKNESI